MKNTMSLLASVLAMSIATADAATISLSPSSPTIQVGDQFTVTMQMDFSDEPTLGGGVDVLYNSTLADFVSFTFDSGFLALSDPSMTCPGNVLCSPSIDQPGAVTNIAFGNFFGLDGPYTVGTLVFNALDAGAIALSVSETSGTAGPFVSAVSYEPMIVEYNGTSVVVSAVPLPASAWLLASGLGLLGIRRKRA